MSQVQSQPQAVSFSQAESTVSSPLLLSIYGVVPLFAILIGLDVLVFESAVKAYLPSNPKVLIWWAIIFGFPHIVSSFVTLADSEYVAYYKDRFWKALKIILVGVFAVDIVIPLVAPGFIGNGIYALFLLFFATYSMYHVLSQQFGVGAMMMKVRPGTVAYERWRRTATVAATALYLVALIRPNLESAVLGGVTLYDVMLGVAGVFAVISGYIGWSLTKESKRQLGTAYVLSNVLMLISVFVFALLDYSFFVLVVPRLIHDFTAFVIYSTHDQNRNREVQHNYIYRFLSFLPIPPLFLCVPLAVLIGASVECGSYFLDFSLGFDPGTLSECGLSHYYSPTVDSPLPASMQIGLQIMFICGFFHYYIEGFVWKREAIHRHSVPFS